MTINSVNATRENQIDIRDDALQSLDHIGQGLSDLSKDSAHIKALNQMVKLLHQVSVHNHGETKTSLEVIDTRLRLMEF